jgi:hypothetical protein
MSNQRFFKPGPLTHIPGFHDAVNAGFAKQLQTEHRDMSYAPDALLQVITCDGVGLPSNPYYGPSVRDMLVAYFFQKARSGHYEEGPNCLFLWFGRQQELVGPIAPQILSWYRGARPQLNELKEYLEKQIDIGSAATFCQLYLGQGSMVTPELLLPFVLAHPAVSDWIHRCAVVNGLLPVSHFERLSMLYVLDAKKYEAVIEELVSVIKEASPMMTSAYPGFEAKTDADIKPPTYNEALKQCAMSFFYRFGPVIWFHRSLLEVSGGVTPDKNVLKSVLYANTEWTVVAEGVLDGVDLQTGGPGQSASSVLLGVKPSTYELVGYRTTEIDATCGDYLVLPEGVVLPTLTPEPLFHGQVGYKIERMIGANDGTPCQPLVGIPYTIYRKVNLLDAQDFWNDPEFVARRNTIVSCLTTPDLYGDDDEAFCRVAQVIQMTLGCEMGPDKVLQVDLRTGARILAGALHGHPEAWDLIELLYAPFCQLARRELGIGGSSDATWKAIVDYFTGQPHNVHPHWFNLDLTIKKTPKTRGAGGKKKAPESKDPDTEKPDTEKKPRKPRKPSA